MWRAKPKIERPADMIPGPKHTMTAIHITDDKSRGSGREKVVGKRVRVLLGYVDSTRECL